MEKTVITHINSGFDFLGWNFRKFKGKLIIKPSPKSMRKVTKKISEIIKNNRTTKQEILIQRLNQVLIGWANYHQGTCAKKCFGTIDNRTWKMLWKWAKRRHPNKKHQKLQCLSPAKKYKLYKSSINKSLHFAQRRLSSSTRG